MTAPVSEHFPSHLPIASEQGSTVGNVLRGISALGATALLVTGCTAEQHHKKPTPTYVPEIACLPAGSSEIVASGTGSTTGMQELAGKKVKNATALEVALCDPRQQAEASIYRNGRPDTTGPISTFPHGAPFLAVSAKDKGFDGFSITSNRPVSWQVLAPKFVVLKSPTVDPNKN